MNASFLLAFYGRAVAEGEELRKTRHGVKELKNFLKYQVSHWTHWVERKPMVGNEKPRGWVTRRGFLFCLLEKVDYCRKRRNNALLFLLIM